MATIFEFCCTNLTSAAASATRTLPLAVGGGSAVAGSANEAANQTTYRSAGTLANLYCRVTSNDRGASTFKSRVNAANGSQSISVGASTTGEFQDTANTDAIVAGDEADCRFITGAGGTTFILAVYGASFAATTNTVSRHHQGSIGSNAGGASATVYAARSGVSPNALQTTESFAQFTLNAAGTLANLFANSQTNSRSDATTVRSRVNGANGGMSLSIGASTTGLFEDTTNTDTIAANDLVNSQAVTGAGTGTINFSGFAAELTTTDSTFHAVAALTNGSVVNASVTTNFPAGGWLIASATEADVQTLATVAYTASNLECRVSANTVTAASTLAFRTNAANGNQSVSIGASTTGVFEDTTNSDVLAATAEVNYQIVTGGTGTSLTLRNMGHLGTIVGAGGGFGSLALLGVGM